jgi:NosR/NirI family nitrous oxide reductase transcriptional regulator
MEHTADAAYTYRGHTPRRAPGPGALRYVPTLLLIAVFLTLSLASRAVLSADLERFLKDIRPADIFPGADRLAAPEGSPLVSAAFSGDTQLGFVFLNSDIVNSTGYSGKPIHVLIAIDMDGVIQGVRLLEHSEPIVLIGIPEKRISAFIDDFIGLNVVKLVQSEEGDHDIDIVSGATVTVMVIDDSVVRSAIRVARAYGLGGLASEQALPTGPKASINMTMPAATEDWIALIGDGSVRRLKLTVGDVNRAFEEEGDAAAIERPESGDPGEVFIELYAALVSIPTIGKSVLGDGEHRNLAKRLKPGQQAILLAADGRYSFKGSGYVRGGIFDRFQLIQGDNSIRFRDRDHKRLRKVMGEGAPDLSEVDLFYIPEDAEFDGAQPWRLQLLVSRATGPTNKAFTTFDLAYLPSEKYLEYEEVEAPAPSQASAPRSNIERSVLWKTMWKRKIPEIIVLMIALTVLTFIFFAQNWLVKRPKFAERIRIGFLIFTLFGIGIYAGAQLSVVNIMTVFSALVGGFDWAYFLMEPMIFILWGSVAISLLFWGRGAFCGWLCPFGALQELLNRIAKALRIPQYRVPWVLHERLWPVKYIIFLALFGVSLHSLTLAEQLAEVEPFKTAIVLRFIREWPFVVFALALLVAGLFIERFYCRYLCALGAALAIPARMRMFEWLKRYPACGSRCQRCANDCMVQAIHPEGHINPNECLYCLHCQQLYYDDHQCPVMIEKRLKRERQAARTSADSGAQIANILTEMRGGGGTNPGDTK